MSAVDPLILAARLPLVQKHRVPVDWIAGLDVHGLTQLHAAIRLAEYAGMDWREEWVNDNVPARTVIGQILPCLEREATRRHGRAGTRQIMAGGSSAAPVA